MNKKLIAVLLAFVMLFTTPVAAKETKMYGSKGELWAFTRESLTRYTDEYGSSSSGVVPRHKGMKVLDTSGAYYEVTYTQKGKRKYGYISKEDYRDQCLKYDGSDIVNVTDGTYLLGGQEVVVENVGNNACYLYVKVSNKYLT
ncbi:MAG: hypothetical protein MJ087_06400, partial [Lachnospiraceae bacterium]|nr:hypothetical protein [Lachnospiraceae bacterium]